MLPSMLMLLLYLVVESDINTVVKFLVSKTRVAPLQNQTIPRLELLSAFLLSKLIASKPLHHSDPSFSEVLH